MDLGVFVLHIDPKEIADREHGYELALAHDWEVADVGLIHLVDGRLIILVDIGNDQVGCHHLVDRRVDRVKPTVHHALNHVAFREYPDQLSPVEDARNPDVVLGHDVHCLRHGCMLVNREQKAIAHDVTKCLHCRSSHSYRLPYPMASLSLKHTGNGLMTTVRFVGLLAIEPEGFEYGRVLDGEEHRFTLPRVRVLMPGPRRHHEEIPLAPVEALALDHTKPLPGEHLIDGAARLAVRLCLHARPDQLDPAADRTERRAAGGGIDILHRHIVEGAGVAPRQLF